MPEAVVASSSTALTIRRSPRGLSFMRETSTQIGPDLTAWHSKGESATREHSTSKAASRPGARPAAPGAGAGLTATYAPSAACTGRSGLNGPSNRRPPGGASRRSPHRAGAACRARRVDLVAAAVRGRRIGILVDVVHDRVADLVRHDGARVGRPAQQEDLVVAESGPLVVVADGRVRGAHAGRSPSRSPTRRPAFNEYIRSRESQ